MAGLSCKPRLSGCTSSCLHWQLVQEYRDARDARDAGRERGDAMRMEDDDYSAEWPQLTFKAWLQGNGRGRT